MALTKSRLPRIKAYRLRKDGLQTKKRVPYVDLGNKNMAYWDKEKIEYFYFDTSCIIRPIPLPGWLYMGFIILILMGILGLEMLLPPSILSIMLLFSLIPIGLLVLAAQQVSKYFGSYVIVPENREWALSLTKMWQGRKVWSEEAKAWIEPAEVTQDLAGIAPFDSKEKDRMNERLFKLAAGRQKPLSRNQIAGLYIMSLITLLMLGFFMYRVGLFR